MGYIEEAERGILSRVVVTVPLMHKALSPNARCHWATKARAVKLAREHAKASALLFLYDWGRENGIRFPPPRWSKAGIRATFYLRDRRGTDADQDNRIASLKATIDGIAEAGVVENDKGLVWASPPIAHAIDAKRPRVEVEVKAA